MPQHVFWLTLPVQTQESIAKYDWASSIEAGLPAFLPACVYACVLRVCRWARAGRRRLVRLPQRATRPCFQCLTSPPSLPPSPSSRELRTFWGQRNMHNYSAKYIWQYTRYLQRQHAVIKSVFFCSLHDQPMTRQCVSLISYKVAQDLFTLSCWCHVQRCFQNATITRPRIVVWVAL